MMTKLHSFMLLNTSALPALSSLNALNFTLSATMFMKFSFNSLFIYSTLCLIFSAYIWWSIYSDEINNKGYFSKQVEHCMKVAMLLFISSEILFFFSFFWSYFEFSLAPSMESGFSWPPKGLKFFDPMELPLSNTMILLLSGLTVTLSHNSTQNGKTFESCQFMFYTIILGLSFSILQAMEYSNSFFCMNDSVFGTSFFVLTGFHGLHVLIGTSYLSVILYYMIFGKTSNYGMTSFEMASWYWHFVDVVWIFLYFFLYYLPSADLTTLTEANVKRMFFNDTVNLKFLFWEVMFYE